MALPAFQLLKEFLAMLNRFDGDFRLGGNFYGIAWLFSLKARREGFDERYQIGALLAGEGEPRRHVGHNEPAPDRIVEIFVGGQSSGRRRTALENRRVKISWLDIQVRLSRIVACGKPILTAAVAAKAMASPAETKVELSAGIGMPRE